MKACNLTRANCNIRTTTRVSGITRFAAEADWAHSSGSHSVRLGLGCVGAPALVAARVAADGGRAAAHGTAAARSGRAVAVVDYALGRTRGDDLRTT